MKRILFFAFILGLATSSTPLGVLAHEKTPLESPQTVQEAQKFGLGILKTLPDAVKKVWQEQVVPLWIAMWNWIKNLWNSTIYSWVQGIIDGVLFNEKK